MFVVSHLTVLTARDKKKLELAINFELYRCLSILKFTIKPMKMSHFNEQHFRMEWEYSNLLGEREQKRRAMNKTNRQKSNYLV